jgi:hypothetical protein
MRKLISLVLMACTGVDAAAHPLPGDPPLAEQLWHQWLSPHHAPVVFLLLIAAGLLVLAAKVWQARNRQ